MLPSLTVMRRCCGAPMDRPPIPPMDRPPIPPATSRSAGRLPSGNDATASAQRMVTVEKRRPRSRSPLQCGGASAATSSRKCTLRSALPAVCPCPALDAAAAVAASRRIAAAAERAWMTSEVRGYSACACSAAWERRGGRQVENEVWRCETGATGLPGAKLCDRFDGARICATGFTLGQTYATTTSDGSLHGLCFPGRSRQRRLEAISCPPWPQAPFLPLPAQQPTLSQLHTCANTVLLLTAASYASSHSACSDVPAT
eukprot:355147-Chlamydomonas_euryale.AAC.2